MQVYNVFLMGVWDQQSVLILCFAQQRTCLLTLTRRLFPNIDNSENFV